MHAHMSASIIGKASPKLKKQNRLYQSLNEYKNEASSFENLSIENFRTIFIVFFLVCSLLILFFSFNVVYTNFFRKRRFFRRFSHFFALNSTDTTLHLLQPKVPKLSDLNLPGQIAFFTDQIIDCGSKETIGKWGQKKGAKFKATKL